MSEFTIDIDTGGTFTDGYIAGGGVEAMVKVDTTPHDLTVCFYNCVEQGARQLGLDTPELLDQTRVIRFSSTIATNAAVQLDGPKLGVLVTKGHEQDLYAGDGGGVVGTFVPAHMVVGLKESVDETGKVSAEPDAADIDDAVRFLLENGARMLVICLRNAHINPANEIAVRRIIDSAYPRHYLGAVPMLASHQVSRMPDDALRANTAVVNAYFHRVLVRSLYKAEDLVRKENYRYPLMIVTADYGVSRVAKTKAITTYQSGPASGVRGAHVLGRERNHPHVLCIDVGGTTSDVSFVARGRSIAADYRPINGANVAQRMPAIVSFGVGGGSKLRLSGDGITVGPDSQGAVPGPACFGLGGSMVTPTDIWLALGLLDPGAYLGGRKRLQPEKAEQAIDKQLAGPLGLRIGEAALRAKDAAEASLARQIVDSGLIPEATPLAETMLYAVGGGAGLLAAGLARKLGVGGVYVPPSAAVFSAFGASTLDVAHTYEEIVPVDGRKGAAADLAGILQALAGRAAKDMRGEGYGRDEIAFVLEAECFAGSERIGHLSPQPADGGVPSAIADVVARPPEGTRFVILRLTASCPKPHPAIAASGGRASSLDQALVGSRRILSDSGAADAPVLRFDRLPLGAEIEGPAIVENEHTSILVPRGACFVVDEIGGGTMEM